MSSSLCRHATCLLYPADVVSHGFGIVCIDQASPSTLVAGWRRGPRCRRCRRQKPVSKESTRHRAYAFCPDGSFRPQQKSTGGQPASTRNNFCRAHVSRGLGLTVPPTLLMTADELIE